MQAYHKRLTSEDDAIRTQAAKAWSTWEYADVVFSIDFLTLTMASTFQDGYFEVKSGSC